MEAVNSQGDGVWDDTNYQWEIQDLRDGGARVAQDKSAEDLKAARQLGTAPQKESAVDATENTDLNEQGSEQNPTSPESALPEKSEAAVKSISS